MKVLVTDFNRDKKIHAIKGVRSVALIPDLKAAKDFVDGPLPAELECRADLSWNAIERALADYGVHALCTDENAAFLQFLAALPSEMSVGALRDTLAALRAFELPGPPSARSSTVKLSEQDADADRIR